MKPIRQWLLRPILAYVARRHIVTAPKVIELQQKRCIGYRITTSFKGNRKKREIPPFYHDIYDNDKLSDLRQEGDDRMYCVFDLHENGQDFDYYVSVENRSGVEKQGCSEITLPAGRYAQVTFMKRNHTAAAMVVGYTKCVWISANGYEERHAPTFIQYDGRFHRNYRAHGCRSGNYPGRPIAVLHIPLK